MILVDTGPLVALRDALLPNLISGQLRLKAEGVNFREANA